jgi:UDP-N-acetylglucosamine acyltransferase
MATIHPTAIVDPQVQLGDGVSIGAYSVIKGPVRIGANTIIHEHSHVQGKTVIGEKCQIGPTAFVGLPPQHLKADPDVGQLIIGDHVMIRETATVHRSIVAGDGHATRLGNRVFLMGSVHVAHDCVLADNVIAANGVLLAGHCQIGPGAFLGGGCTLHQFVRVGRLAIIGGNEKPGKDVPPFAAMRNGMLKAYNAIGCRRAAMNRETIRAIRAAYHALHSHRMLSAAVHAIRQMNSDVPEIAELLEFIATSKRGIVPSHLSSHGVEEGASAPSNGNRGFAESDDAHAAADQLNRFDLSRHATGDDPGS